MIWTFNGGNVKKYKPYTLEQKRAYAKQFTKKERESYRKGKRQGFLEGVHKPIKKNSRYTKEEINGLFTNVKDIKF